MFRIDKEELCNITIGILEENAITNCEELNRHRFELYAECNQKNDFSMLQYEKCYFRYVSPDDAKILEVLSMKKAGNDIIVLCRNQNRYGLFSLHELKAQNYQRLWRCKLTINCHYSIPQKFPDYMAYHGCIMFCLRNYLIGLLSGTRNTGPVQYNNLLGKNTLAISLQSSSFDTLNIRITDCVKTSNPLKFIIYNHSGASATDYFNWYMNFTVCPFDKDCEFTLII